MEISFTERELDIMTVLWARGPSTVNEVRDALQDALAYNTVLTMLGVLEEKGYVDHEAEGRAYRFYPLVEQAAAGESALRRIVRAFFPGAPETVLMHLVDAEGTSDADIERMREVLRQKLERGEDP